MTKPIPEKIEGTQRTRKTVEVGGKNFRVSEVPPIEALDNKLIELSAKRYRILPMDTFDGRKIMHQYPMTMLPKIGDYNENEELFRLLMRYVEVEVAPNVWQKLDTDELIKQHVSAKDTIVLEREVVDLTTGFFSSGKLTSIAMGATEFFIQKIILTLTQLSGELLQAEKQPSEK
ncbi:hypothetical protein IKF15_00370 [Candidatus Saccharibacteria bacterium]|jgi:hypothetical protein|nr:hypothetical protein [Candidatus Saccharibacteria bacterium]